MKGEESEVILYGMQDFSQNSVVLLQIRIIWSNLTPVSKTIKFESYYIRNITIIFENHVVQSIPLFSYLKCETEKLLA